MKYDEEQFQFMAEELGLPISKVIMILDNPPDKDFESCKNCKENKIK